MGDRYVLERMLATGATLGGEQSGHVVDLGHHTTGDGLATALHAARGARPAGHVDGRAADLIVPFPQRLVAVRRRPHGACRGRGGSGRRSRRPRRSSAGRPGRAARLWHRARGACDGGGGGCRVVRRRCATIWWGSSRPRSEWAEHVRHRRIRRWPAVQGAPARRARAAGVPRLRLGRASACQRRRRDITRSGSARWPCCATRCGAGRASRAPPGSRTPAGRRTAASTEANAHPIEACEGSGVTVVHNGIIENYAALRRELAGRAATCSTPTPTPR